MIHKGVHLNSVAYHSPQYFNRCVVMATVVDVTNEETILVAMESTACEPHHAPLPELSGVSSITSQVPLQPLQLCALNISNSSQLFHVLCIQSESAEGPEQQQQQLRVYLKVRPFSEDELKSNEDQVMPSSMLSPQTL